MKVHLGSKGIIIMNEFRSDRDATGPSRRSAADFVKPGQFKPAKWLTSLPNRLTLARIAATPVILLLYPLDFFALDVFCALLFIAAAVTDWLDGYLARKYQSVTPLGALLDPIADKLLIAAALVVLVASGKIPAFLAGLMICRDLGVSGLRLMALEKNLMIDVSEFGKWKTGLQDVGIVCLMINRTVLQLPLRTIGMVSMWVALVLSLYSAYAYGKSFWQNSKDSF